MTGNQILAYEELRDKLLKKGEKIIKEKYNLHFSCNFHPDFEEEGIRFPVHDGYWMKPWILITWEELGI